MANTKQEAIAKIRSHVGARGGSYSQWYAGVTATPRERLFDGHAVEERNGVWIWVLCTTSAVAREVEDYFIAFGMQGGSGGGDANSRYVYAYKITRTTKE
jgi:hypothetical protein